MADVRDERRPAGAPVESEGPFVVEVRPGPRAGQWRVRLRSGSTWLVFESREQAWDLALTMARAKSRHAREGVLLLLHDEGDRIEGSQLFHRPGSAASISRRVPPGTESGV